MKSNNFIKIFLIIVFVVIGIIFIKNQNKSKDLNSGVMELKSNSFNNFEKIQSIYTCEGKNISPPLTISNIPLDAKSLSISLLDPDAPGSTFTHWLLWNLPLNIVEIKEGQKPPGALEGTNDYGNIGYDGPCPPTGTHRYVFKLTALDKILDLSARASQADFAKAIKGHIISEAQMIGHYK